MVSTTSDETAAVEVQQQVPPTTEEIKQISEEEFEKAQKTFQLGKKNLFLNKFDESVNNIDEACKIYSAKYGEIDPRCAEVYFFYGRALLELARVENNVLGNALDGVPEENEPINDSRYGDPDKVPAEEQKEITEKVIDALCEKRENEKKTEEKTETVAENGTKSTDKVEEKMEQDEKKDELATKVEEKIEEKITEEQKTEKKEEETAEKKEGEQEEEADEEEEGDEEEEVEEDGEPTDEKKEEADAENDEISSLQRAWEMFELAKLIYTKHYDESSEVLFKNKRIAECLVKLGEISIEQEVYEQACTDIAESIRIQEEVKAEERDDRMLAESYYQFGLAQQFNNQFAEAKESFQKSINILQFRIEKLRSKLEACKPDETAEKTTIGDEIKDLEALLPEMNSKLEELAEQSEQTKNLVKECLGGANTGSNGAAVPSINGEVKDITSLVKSKRKISSSNLNGEDDTTKKTRLGEDGKEINDNAETTENTNNTETKSEKMNEDNAEKPVVEEEKKSGEATA